MKTAEQWIEERGPTKIRQSDDPDFIRAIQLDAIERPPPAAQPSTTPALKPCPFCGGPAEVYNPKKRGGWIYVNKWVAICSLCQLELPNLYTTEAQAIEVWNHRTP